MSLSEAEAAFEHPVLELETLAEMFERSVDRNGDRPAQRYKGGIYDRSLAGEGDATPLEPAPAGEFASTTYDDMAHLVRRIAAGFRDLGITDDERVGIFADTRMEWALSDFGILAAGGIVTTVYKSSSPDQIRYLLDDPDASGVVIENETLLERVLEVEDELGLEFYVVFDDLESDEYATRDDIVTIGDLYRRGDEAFDRSEYESWLDARNLDDLASLIYTSGTTGEPKGVKLTHRNLRSNVTQLYRRYGPRDDKGEDDPSITPDSLALSFLPLAHVFERTAGHFMLFAAGACIAYGESPETFAEDLGAVGATSTTAVPRVYEKLYDGIRESAAEDEDRKEALEWALDVARRYNEADDPDEELESELADADELVFATIREKLGGNLEFMVSGGGSLSPDLCRLYHAMGLPIFEGYGMTETSPVIATNPPSDPRVGTVGPSLAGVETELDTSVVRDEDFGDEGEVGELLVRGPNVTEGYWNKPGATDRTFTEDVSASSAELRSAYHSSGQSPREDEASGESEDSSSGRWLRTGDIVHERPDGYLEFRERTKQLLVLSTGKNVAPGPLEDAFASVDVVEQAMVVGDGEKFVGALLVPNVEALAGRAESEGVSLPDDIETLVENEWVLEGVEAAVDEVNEDFESYETIKEFRLVPEGFTEENDLVTPTMKKRRSKIADRYEHLVADIYVDDATETSSD